MYKRQLEEPLRQISKNAGIDGSVIVENVKSSHKNGYGYDALKGCLLYTSGKASTPANSLNSTHLPSITGMPASGPMSPSPRTVSYTHLDVYKRQASVCAGERGEGDGVCGDACSAKRCDGGRLLMMLLDGMGQMCIRDSFSFMLRYWSRKVRATAPSPQRSFITFVMWRS